MNVAPAIGLDGAIYTVSVAHSLFADRYGYLVALNPDLSLRWAASLRDRLQDGCGSSSLPPNGQPGGCRIGANFGFDPTTNEAPAGSVSPNTTSSPVVAPDGSVLFGASTRYNNDRGHLFHFNAAGVFLGAYDFGYDITPAVFPHDGTYSIILKDNHYQIGSYCNDEQQCPAPPPGPYSITSLNSSLQVEWSWRNTNSESCVRNGDGSISCTPDHPGGFEWCVNAPAVDAQGNVFANSEDGNVYVIDRFGTLRSHLFLKLALGAAYTPISIGADGKIYAQNAGHLYVLGN